MRAITDDRSPGGADPGGGALPPRRAPIPFQPQHLQQREARAGGHRRGSRGVGCRRPPPRVRPRGPLEGPAALERSAPFLAAAALALLLTDVLNSADAGESLFEASAIFAAGVVVAIVTPWDRLPAWTQAIPPLAFLALVAMVREAEGGAGATSTPMLALPVIWFALYGSRVELALAAIGGGLVIALPVAIGGADAGYPDTELRAAATWLGVLGIGGYAISALVRQRESLLADVTALARTDPLTGLANRRGWQELLRREVARAQRDHGSFSVALDRPRPLQGLQRPSTAMLPATAC